MTNSSSGFQPTRSFLLNYDDRVLLYIGMAWFWTLALAGVALFLALRKLLDEKPLRVGGIARIIVMCGLLGTVWMYSASSQFVVTRSDGVVVRTPMVYANGFIMVLLTYAGCVHNVLMINYEVGTMVLAIIGTVHMVVASFSDSVDQWAGWVVGFLWFVPIPFIWMFRHQRPTPPGKVLNAHVVLWITMWFGYWLMYGLLQLMGSTFAAGKVFGTTDELALTLVLQTATIVPLAYQTWVAQPPPDYAHPSVAKQSAGLYASRLGE